MRVTYPLALAFAAYTTPALAYTAEMFKCIQPEAHCCAILSTTGTGVNCQPALLENMNTMLGETDPDDDSSPYASVCYVDPEMSVKTPQIPACCDNTSTSMTPNLNTFNCVPPETGSYRYDSETRNFSSSGEDTYGSEDYCDPRYSGAYDDDDWYLYE
ncbi:uncharacterized protein LY89DRAFT_777330 [Mollisia scopiformis]|uniref:Uncharacterized protein n=1 Tax=Mollisia scopiformis TaxID=149040 RepID=A0A194XTH1_MOLSC|nr:uncharacterized protein LY89DRAFT_777330 [Mollisia scopiformis]KUJ23615.1 hypothetical protein LY89DRAFT_777330 [Mollisia scopiformis]